MIEQPQQHPSLFEPQQPTKGTVEDDKTSLKDGSNHTRSTTATTSTDENDDNSSHDNDSDNNDISDLELGESGRQASIEADSDDAISCSDSTPTNANGSSMEQSCIDDESEGYLMIPRSTSICQNTAGQQQQFGCVPTCQYVPNCCAICLASYGIGERVAWSTNPNCKHAFHRSCIVEYLITMKDGTGNPCPICRQPFTNLNNNSSPFLIDDDGGTTNGGASNDDHRHHAGRQGVDAVSEDTYS